jgi:hypothetical protein
MLLKPALALAAFILLATAAPPAPAASQSRSCQTVAGWTICIGAAGDRAAIQLSCRTINGSTTCLGSGGLRCEAAPDTRPICRGGAGYDIDITPANQRQSLGAPAIEDDDDDDLD